MEEKKQIIELLLKTLEKNLQFEVTIHKDNIDWNHIKQMAEEALKAKESITNNV